VEKEGLTFFGAGVRSTVANRGNSRRYIEQEGGGGRRSKGGTEGVLSL